RRNHSDDAHRQLTARTPLPILVPVWSMKSPETRTLPSAASIEMSLKLSPACRLSSLLENFLSVPRSTRTSPCVDDVASRDTYTGTPSPSLPGPLTKVSSPDVMHMSGVKVNVRPSTVS